MSRRNNRRRKRRKGCGGCLASFLFFTVGLTGCVIGYNTEGGGLWLLIGILLVSLGIGLSIQIAMSEDDYDFDDETWWLD